MILKYILCVLVLLYGICALIAHNYHVSQAAMASLAQSQAMPFDGGSISKSLTYYRPK